MVNAGEGGTRRGAVLTTPLSLERDSDVDYRAPNLLKRILSLFKNVRSGSNLTCFQLPPVFNIPKSHLQCYGESVYSVNNDLLSQCAAGETAIDRFTLVVAWSVSTLRPLVFGVAPFNPVLGETHHVSRGALNVFLEQVSHHPPISALHATNEKDNVELIWCQHPVPKFYGSGCIETEVHGKRRLNLLNHGESYVMNSPKLSIRFLPTASVEWVGNVRIRCEESGLEAELCYRGGSFFSRRANHRAVGGKMYESSSLKTIYEIEGHWDRVISVKDVRDGKLKVIYDAKEVIGGLKTPILKDPEGVRETESSIVWSEVSQGILSKNWDKAKEAKRFVEEKERELVKERKLRGESWTPKHFNLFHSKEAGWESQPTWDCSPIQKWVPPGPIVAP